MQFPLEKNKNSNEVIKCKNNRMSVNEYDLCFLINESQITVFERAATFLVSLSFFSNSRPAVLTERHKKGRNSGSPLQQVCFISRFYTIIYSSTIHCFVFLHYCAHKIELFLCFVCLFYN